MSEVTNKGTPYEGGRDLWGDLSKALGVDRQTAKRMFMLQTYGGPQLPVQPCQKIGCNGFARSPRRFCSMECWRHRAEAEIAWAKNHVLDLGVEHELSYGTDKETQVFAPASYLSNVPDPKRPEPQVVAMRGDWADEMENL